MFVDCIYMAEDIVKLLSQPGSPMILVFRLDTLALSVIATATWLGGWVAGWVAVTLRYCIKTAKPIQKLFRPSERPMTLVSWDPCADTKLHGEPLQRGVKYTGGGKIGEFRAIYSTSPFISETVLDRPMVTMER